MVLRHSIKASFCADCAMCQLVNGLFEASLAAVSALYGLVNIVQLEGSEGNEHTNVVCFEEGCTISYDLGDKSVLGTGNVGHQSTSRALRVHEANIFVALPIEAFE